MLDKVAELRMDGQVKKTFVPNKYVITGSVDLTLLFWNCNMGDVCRAPVPCVTS